MNELNLPLIELAVALLLAAAAGISRLRDSHQARKWSVMATGLAFVCCIGAWLNAGQPQSGWHLLSLIGGERLFALDDLSGPLLAMAALLYFLMLVATPRTKLHEFSFPRALVAEAILLATFACRSSWGLVLLLALATILPWLELRARRRSTRVYTLHMALFVGLLVVGQLLVPAPGGSQAAALPAMVLLLLAVLIRSGIAPFHLWVADLFEHAMLATAMLFVLPLTGTYAALRLILPAAPDSILQGLQVAALVTAVYASGMTLVQREARRFVCYLFLSLSASVLVGLAGESPIGFTGALCVWLSVALALGGFGLVVRGLEARFGRMSLDSLHGLYEHTPTMALFFAITGLASVGFPGTLGFVGTEMLIDGAVAASPVVGVALILAATLNGIAVIRAYFQLFTGPRHMSSVSLHIRIRERVAVLTLAALLLGGGVWAQPWIASRHQAAENTLARRTAESAKERPLADTSPREQQDSPPSVNPLPRPRSVAQSTE